MDRYGIQEMIGFARRLDVGLTDRDFADAGEPLDRWGDRGVRPVRSRPRGRGAAA